MQSNAHFDLKISITPSQLNQVKTMSIEDILLRAARSQSEGKCSEHGYVVPGTLEILSRSMGYYESARFTGDVNYYVKCKATVIYPVNGYRVTGEVIRNNKMGLYVAYRVPNQIDHSMHDAIRIQVPRDLHLGNAEFAGVEIGDQIEVELLRSKFSIYDSYILSNGMYISTVKKSRTDEPNRDDVELDMEQEQEQEEQADEEQEEQADEEEQPEEEEQEE